jgi:Rrf2 family protein
VSRAGLARAPQFMKQAEAQRLEVFDFMFPEPSSPMRLTKQTGHAIRILIDCATSGVDLIKVAKLSERLGITRQNVFKVVNRLTHAGFLASVRGPSGGVRLARPATEIRIGDVVRAMEETTIKVASSAEVPASVRTTGPLNSMFDTAFEAFVEVLDQHTLADFMQLDGPHTRRGEPQRAAKRRPASAGAKGPNGRPQRRA